MDGTDALEVDCYKLVYIRQSQVKVKCSIMAQWNICFDIGVGVAGS